MYPKSLVLKIISLVVLLLVSSCATRLQSLQKADFQGDPFRTTLAKKYLEFAESEADQYDWYDSEYFAKKGLKVLKGENLGPENLDDWNITQENITTLIQARKYLTSALANGAKGKFPHKAALAQANFDCWVEQQEEDWQKGDIDKCRENFYRVLDDLFSLISIENTHKEQKIEGKKTKLKKFSRPVKEIRVVYFGFDKYHLDKKAHNIVDSIVKNIGDKESYKVTLKGYSDPAGDKDYNMKLSMKRAKAIKLALVKAGLSKDNILIFGYGSIDRPIVLSTGRKVKTNRVVEIVVDR